MKLNSYKYYIYHNLTPTWVREEHGGLYVRDVGAGGSNPLSPTILVEWFGMQFNGLGLIT